MKLGTASYIHLNEFINVFNGPVEVGNYTSIARGCVFLSGALSRHHCQENPLYVSTYGFRPATRWDGIHIGSDVWIGTESLIMDGVTIGHGAIIGARTVVTKDVEPYSVVVGNHRIVRKRFTEDVIEKLLEIAWWNWDHPFPHEFAKAGKFDDVNKFVEEFYGKPSPTNLK